jgi:hypothetical protein
VKNGRWYLVGPRTACKVGWGDLALADLRAIAESNLAGWLFLALPESPPGGQHLPFTGEVGTARLGDWCWYDRPDHQPGPDLATLAAAAHFAVFDGLVYRVDALERRNRDGKVWISPGYRVTRTGRLIRAGRVKLPAVTPDELHDALTATAGPGNAVVHAVTAFDPHAVHE